MKYEFVKDNNFEDIFEVSAKYEQWAHVKHQIFDMVNNYVAIINGLYLPIPFLVYDGEELIAYVQINYYSNKSIADICKLIVHESQQNKGYGRKILAEMIHWITNEFKGATITSSYNKDNLCAEALFAHCECSKIVTGDITNVTLEHRIVSPIENIYVDKIPYSNIENMVLYLEKYKKLPDLTVGNSDGIHFERISKEKISTLIEMEIDESQEDFVMPFVDSIASAYSELYEEEITLAWAICDGEKTIGLFEIVYANGDEYPELKGEKVYELFRVIIDKRFQRSGYGKKAVEVFLDYVKQKPLGEADNIVVSVVEGNEVAYKLYEKYGFEYFGRDKYNYRAMKRSI